MLVCSEPLVELQGQVVQNQNLGLYEGPIPVMLDQITNEPMLHWHGAKITKYMWQTIISFLRWTYDSFHSESQLRLYYNETTNRWKAIVMPQYINTGLSSDEVANHKSRELVTACVSPDNGWRPAGTVHHHCNIGAFQSGTDFSDEIDQNGLHITVGRLSQDSLDIHARATFRKVLYTVDLDEWVAPTEAERAVPHETRFPNIWR